MNVSITIGKRKNGAFVSNDEMFIKDIDSDVANTIIAGYYKGMDRDNANGVLVIDDEDNKQSCSEPH